MSVVTRFAPTPSGYLHRGNAANALLVSWLARAEGGTLVLRVDDGDVSRVRPEYVADVFGLLDWLGIAWQLGPADPADLDSRWSARFRVEQHRAALQDAVARGLPVYACGCSRAAQRGPATGGCQGGCREQDLPLVPGRTALRVAVPLGTTVAVGGTDVRLDDALGDFVVWRRDDLPAYQLASVVDDRDLGITDIVRGVDLLPSSAAQLHLAAALDAPTFASARFRHHGLVTALDGTKLSKSQQGDGAPLPRTADERAVVDRLARELGTSIGIAPPA